MIYIVSKNNIKPGSNDMQLIIEPNPKEIGDNMVGFLSQIGWSGDNSNINTPEPRI